MSPSLSFEGDGAQAWPKPWIQPVGSFDRNGGRLRTVLLSPPKARIAKSRAWDVIMPSISAVRCPKGLPDCRSKKHDDVTLELYHTVGQYGARPQVEYTKIAVTRPAMRSRIGQRKTVVEGE